ncbi:DUF2269 family protein [Pusillimonas noertemannii]|uniref:DUF2269 family protein n=1 Tax=Pusillimonas noertemannii TaxID=305977 RepID=UPI0002D35BE9|nr:DUF2269 domain-containing protein [Pusillimonas noertemannii]
MEYLTVKWLHVLGSTLLFGTGIGSAFYLLLASLSKDTAVVAKVSAYVVIADYLFTATTALAQPLTGFWLVHLAGFPLSAAWLYYSIFLYGIAIACWLPVVGIQVHLRNLARDAAQQQVALPRAYWYWFRIWIALGVPAFFAFVAIFYLMVFKPAAFS